MSLRRRWLSMRRTSPSTSARPMPRWNLRPVGPPSAGSAPRVSAWMMLLAASVLLLNACTMPGNAAPVLKIGLIAPFEGLGRPLGYAVLPAVQEVIATANASGEFGAYRLLLVALNDDLDPAAAAAQAAALAGDSSVIAVVGPFTMPTAARAAPVLAELGVPTLVAAPLDSPPANVFSLCPDAAALTGEIERAAQSVTLASCSENAINEPTTQCALNPDKTALSEVDVDRIAAAVRVFWPGEATEVAAWLAGDPGTNFEGVLLGGPDLLKPWFAERTGAAGEGARAVACSLRGHAAGDTELPEAALARAGAEEIVRAVASSVEARRAPTRAHIAATLGVRPFEHALVWYEVAGGRWLAME